MKMENTNAPNSLTGGLGFQNSAQNPPQNAQNLQGVTQLDFNQAMSDFKIMFPDMPEDIIEAVLRQNKGIVDATIDELLKISTQQNPVPQNNTHSSQSSFQNSNYNPSSSALVHQQQSGQHSNTTLASSSASTSKHHNHNYWNPAQTPESSTQKSYTKSFLSFNDKAISKDSLRYRNNWNPPMLGELPANFLRISMNETQRKLTSNNVSEGNSVNSPNLGNDAAMINTTMLQAKMEENERNRQTASQDDPELAQFLADERFAILLQNEEFVRELRLNQDFMSTLDGGFHGSRPGTAEGSSQPASSSTMPDSDAAFKERLKNMSKVSKRKFAQLARLFSGKSKKNFQHRQLDDANGNDYQYCDTDFTNENYEDFRSRGRIN